MCSVKSSFTTYITSTVRHGRFLSDAGSSLLVFKSSDLTLKLWTHTMIDDWNKFVAKD